MILNKRIRRMGLFIAILFSIQTMAGCGLQSFSDANHVLPATAGQSATDPQGPTEAGVFSAYPAGQDTEYDLIILNGRVIDPETGRDEIAHVAVKDGVIQKISVDPELAAAGAARVIDAAGRVVAPGFINTHTHEGQAKGVSNLEALPPATRYYVQDGITFWLGGHCGASPTGIDIPVDEETAIEWGDHRQPLSEFLDEAETLGLYNHCGFLSGNMTLRSNVGLRHGDGESGEQIQAMQAILERDLAAGSFGISYGLMYDMGATEEACTALAKTASAAGGMAASHVRYPLWNLSHLLLGINAIVPKSAINEAIDTCRESGVPMMISHITDMAQSGSSPWAFKAIDEAIRDEGLPLAGDIIAHDYLKNDAYVLTLKGKIPVRLLFMIGGYKATQFYAGRDFYMNGELYAAKYDQLTLRELEYLRKNMRELDIPLGETGLSVPVICEIIPPEDTILGLQYPWCFIGNDASVAHDPLTGEWGVNSPRALATFSQLLGRWTRDEEALTLHQAVFKTSFAPAYWLGLDKKGRLQEGCDADITVFDPQTVRHLAQWVGGTEHLAPEGIDYVIVNGQVVVEQGKLTGVTPGRVIRRTWTVPGDTTGLISVYEQRF